MKIILILLLLCLSYSSAADDCNRDVEVVCYWGSWSIYRSEIGKFTTENIDPSLCTNIIYSFIGLNDRLEIASLDSRADIDLKGFSNFTAFKQNNSCLKTTLAIGGWNEASIKYSVVASTEENRHKFAQDILSFLVYYGFDGLDLDWEYPTTRGGIPADKQNFPLLLKTIKDTISPWNLTLSTAVSIENDVLVSGYDIKAIAATVDYVHLMAYDYISPSSPVTGLSSPLPAINSSVISWLKGGLNSKQLILGIPAYARTFTLQDSARHGIGDPSSGMGMSGAFTAEDGFLAYYEVLEDFKWGQMTEVHVNGTNYAYEDENWITYENEETVRTKVQYALSKNLGGIMLWSLDTDDFSGAYGRKYPLLNAINEAIRQKRV